MHKHAQACTQKHTCTLQCPRGAGFWGRGIQAEEKANKVAGAGNGRILGEGHTGKIKG